MDGPSGDNEDGGAYMNKLQPSCLKYALLVKHIMCILKSEGEQTGRKGKEL